MKAIKERPRKSKAIEPEALLVQQAKLSQGAHIERGLQDHK